MQTYEQLVDEELFDAIEIAYQTNNNGVWNVPVTHRVERKHVATWLRIADQFFQLVQHDWGTQVYIIAQNDEGDSPRVSHFCNITITPQAR